MKTVNYSLASNFVDFALSSVTLCAKKLDGWIGGARTGDGESSDLPSGLQLQGLSSLEFENRGIPRVIGCSL